jgi:hypothetical protein
MLATCNPSPSYNILSQNGSSGLGMDLGWFRAESYGVRRQNTVFEPTVEMVYVGDYKAKLIRAVLFQGS